MIDQENKTELSLRRTELIARLSPLLSVADRQRLQGELSIVNAKIKALNTTEAAQLKAAADRRRVAGMAEAQANAARAQARTHGTLPGDPGDSPGDNPGPMEASDSWLDALLLRHDVDFSRDPGGKITIHRVTTRAAAELLAPLFEAITAIARGTELPELPQGTTKPARVTKPKKR